MGIQTCRHTCAFEGNYLRRQSIETDVTRKSLKKSPLKWLPGGSVHSSRSIGTVATNAQVHPRLLTTFLADNFATKPNTSILHGKATGLSLKDGTSPESVIIRTDSGDEKIAADVVVLAAGPWTGRLAKELLGEKIGGRVGVTGHKAHSIVVKTKDELTAHCLFTSMTLEDGSMAEPEVYARPDGMLTFVG
jgi:glycine/D-amino acid oxidase-like deaminating enzyme